MRHVKWIALIAVVFATSLGAREVRAGLISYVTTGVGSGSLDGNAFTNQAFTLTILADPSQVQDRGFSYVVNNLSTSVQLGSTRLTALAGSSFSFKNISPDLAGFYYSGGTIDDEIDTFPVQLLSPALLGFDLISPIGPLNLNNSRISYIGTSQGVLSFSSLAQLQFRALAVPEPSTLVMSATAILVGLGLNASRRGRNTIRSGN